MPIHNTEIADIFARTADLLDIKGENQFRVRAYREAARTIKGLSRNVTDMIDENDPLDDLPGIGDDLAGKIRTIVREGKLPLLERLEKEMPGELSMLTHVAGLGPKRVKKLYDELGIGTLDDLKEAAQNDRISGVEGFGAKTQQTILNELARIRKTASRFNLAEAEELVHPLYEHLKQVDGVKKCTIAGSFRRRRETVGDVDILVTCKQGTDIMTAFVSHEDVERVVSKGDTRSTVILRTGLQVDLRVVQQVSYGAALHYFTGSKGHNIAVRKRANGMGYKVNEYGVYEGDDRIAGKTERAVYKAVGLPWYEPELRENRGELDITKQNDLPDLVTIEDIRGDLHTHTTRTDGRNSLEEMTDAARALGYDYIANTEHSKHVSVAGGLSPDEAAGQIERVRNFDDSLRGFTVLAGIEVDILEDGSLDLPDAILNELDVVICSIHYKFNLSKDKQTDRVLRAMDNPHFMIMAHPTGRMINERDPYDIDMEKVLKAAAERGIALEINAHPSRLDLNDIHANMARDLGVKLAVSTDSHNVTGLVNMKYGIGQARRGWLEAADVINTRPLGELKKLLVHRN